MITDKFRPIESEDEVKFNQMIDKNPALYSDFYGSEICFDTLWQWRNAERMTICDLGDSLIIRGFDPELPEGERGRVSYIFPFAESEEAFLRAVRLLAEEEGKNLMLTCLSDRMKELLAPLYPDALFDRWRELDEYLYRTSDLAAFPGKKYHAKRNFVRQFEKSYSYEIVSYDDSRRADVEELLRVWSEEKAEILPDENGAIRAALDRRKNLCAELLYANGKIESFLIGGKCRDFGILMFFKCNTELKGIYPFMLSSVVKKDFSDCAYVSMQEDMGLEGLRKSKESYHPAFLQQKYIMRFE